MKSSSTNKNNDNNVFLSYTLSDKALAEKLTRKLEEAGQSVWIDVEDIRYADNWKDAVWPALERAKAVLFVTSAASLASRNCLEELDYAAELGKRIIPIIAERVSGAPATLKSRVRRDFSGTNDFNNELLRLVKDISSEPEYVELHTHLTFRAARWRADKTGLLDSREIRKANNWVNEAEKQPDLNPHPTPLLTTFIQESKQRIKRRRLKTTGFFLFLFLLIAGSYFGREWWLGIPRAGISPQTASMEEVAARRTVNGVENLHTVLTETLPDKEDRNQLLIATWNIRQLDRHKRPLEALHYIAEIISCFDIVAIQEAMGDQTDYLKIKSLLGNGWQSLESDINEGRRGNQERLAFFYDTRKVALTALVGELNLPESPAETGNPYRSPYFAGFTLNGLQLALCNVHLRWGRNEKDRPIIMKAIADALVRKVDRGRDFPPNFILLGDMNAGSVGGEILNTLESAGLTPPPAVRNLSVSPFQERPYAQIALKLTENDFTIPVEGGVFDFFQYVYKDEEAAVYRSEIEKIRRSGKYKHNRTLLMSDHFPKWISLKIKPNND